MMVYHIAFEVYPFKNLYKSPELIVHYQRLIRDRQEWKLWRNQKYPDNGSKGPLKSQLQLRNKWQLDTKRLYTVDPH